MWCIDIDTLEQFLLSRFSSKQTMVTKNWPFFLIATIALVCTTDSAGFSYATFGVRRGATASRSAIIYAPPWEDEGYFYCDDEEEEEVIRNPSPWMETLSRDKGDTLARLAAAFSPVGHHLDLKHIEHVTVLGIDENHIDIQAVTCEVDGCVTIAVPVPFPSPCTSIELGMEECVMDNLRRLDSQAGEKLREIELNLAHDEENRSYRSTLTSRDKISFPKWWVPPNQMSDECDNVRRLLNDECFQPEVQALARQGLMAVDGREDFVVEHAAIIAVCPTGVYIRARATLYGIFQEAEERIVDIPLAFGHEVKDVGDLRAAILGAVAAAASYVGIENSVVPI